MRIPNSSNPDPPTLWGLVALIVLSLVAGGVLVWMTGR